MSECKYCGRDRGYACNNTRDMEDFAIDGDRECFFRLAESAVVHDCGGEKGMRYVVLNALHNEEARKGIAAEERV